uniref:Uncharacterized protein n=1 Tax=Micrurus spixii TaxID=129469 RepID=A0A2D4LLZ8_9SAUR
MKKTEKYLQNVENNSKNAVWLIEEAVRSQEVCHQAKTTTPPGGEDTGATDVGADVAHSPIGGVTLLGSLHVPGINRERQPRQAEQQPGYTLPPGHRHSAVGHEDRTLTA